MPDASSSKVMLVTGAGTGIGEATAHLGGQMGYAVAVNYRENADRAAEVAATIRDAGGKAITTQADIGDAAAVDQLFETIDRELGTLHVLVNNAGIPGVRARFDEIEPEEWQNTLNVNIAGTFHCIQQAVRRMSTRQGGEGGAIVNVSSMAAQTGGVGLVPYVASKAAINAVTISLARELGPDGIRVNAVSPGVIATDQQPLDDQEWVVRTSASIPVGRLGTPDEVAAAILWLASSEASYITGANLPVTGGR